MSIVQAILASINNPAQGGGGTPVDYDGSDGTVTHNNVLYTLTPTVAGGSVAGVTVGPNTTITWTITSDSSQAGHTIIWWVDNNAVPVNTWVENPYYGGNANAGSVTLDGNGSASWSLTIVGSPPVHNSFRMYISEGLYQGWLTHLPITI